MDKIIIRDLQTRCIIGINDEERREKQDVLVSIILYTDLRKSGESDRLKDSVDYRALNKKVLKMVEGSSFHIIEAFASEVSKICLLEPGVEKVDVLVEKPGALRFARTVGVEISREKGAT
jgi:FolB domain-containing protein